MLTWMIRALGRLLFWHLVRNRVNDASGPIRGNYVLALVLTVALAVFHFTR